jgi:hypothetical protein
MNILNIFNGNTLSRQWIAKIYLVKKAYQIDRDFIANDSFKLSYFEPQWPKDRVEIALKKREKSADIVALKGLAKMYDCNAIPLNGLLSWDWGGLKVDLL